MDPAGTGRRPHLRAPQLTSDRLWLWLFLALVAVALPLLLFHYGQYHWFLRDDWHFLADRGDSRIPDLLDPHGGAHWVALPRLIYLALWQVVGMNSYRPYQAVAVVMHLTVAVLLRVVMRRAGVRPCLATAVAAVFVLCGPGAINTLWGFQVTFIGSLAWGLGHLLLADHDGRFDRRDVVGLLLGLLALMSSAVGITTALAVGIAVLLRRGWRLALAHTVPLAAIHLAWVSVTGAKTSGPFGRPSADVLARWVRDSFRGTFLALGRFPVVTWAIVALLVTGAVLLWGSRRTDRARLAMPVGLATAAVFFSLTTGSARWADPAGAVADRYLYLQAAFLLPLLAVSAEAVCHRWRRLTPVLVALFLLPIPFNLRGFDEGLFGPAYMANRQRILTTAVRMPFARDVSRDVQPAPDPYASDAVTIGFLLTAEANGLLTPSTTPLTPEIVNEFRVRLGVAQRREPTPPEPCPAVPGPIEIDPGLGDELRLTQPAVIRTIEDGRLTSVPVVFQPGFNGTQLTIELPDLHLHVAALRGDDVALCEAGSATPDGG